MYINVIISNIYCSRIRQLDGGEMCNLKVKNRTVMNNKFLRVADNFGSSDISNMYLAKKRENLFLKKSKTSTFRQEKIRVLMTKKSPMQCCVVDYNEADALKKVIQINKDKIEKLFNEYNPRVRRFKSHPVL